MRLLLPLCFLWHCVRDANKDMCKLFTTLSRSYKLREIPHITYTHLAALSSGLSP
jgi:hypothetical protein